MKKVFITVLLSVIALSFTTSTFAYTGEIVNFDIDNQRVDYTDKFNPYEPLVPEQDLDDEINSDGPEIAPMAICANKDSYEGNNSFSAASFVKMSSPGISYQYKYIYATLHQDPWWCFGGTDKDYYLFNVEKTSSVNIQLSNIPSANDYDFAVYRSDQSHVITSAAPNNNIDEKTITLTPGQYYIYVYSFRGYDDTNQYTLRIRIIQTSSAYDSWSMSTIDSSYSSAKGAIWRSEVGIPDVIVDASKAEGKLVPIYKNLVKTRVIIWDNQTMSAVSNELSMFQQQLTNLKNTYGVYDTILNFGLGASGSQVVLNWAAKKAGQTVASGALYGVTAVLTVAQLVVTNQIESLDSAINDTNILIAGLNSVYGTAVVEIIFTANINTLKVWYDYSMSYYTSYNIEYKIHTNRNTYVLQENMSSNMFAGDITFQYSSTPLSTEIQNMINTKKERDRLLGIIIFPFAP